MLSRPRRWRRNVQQAFHVKHHLSVAVLGATFAISAPTPRCRSARGAAVRVARTSAVQRSRRSTPPHSPSTPRPPLPVRRTQRTSDRGEPTCGGETRWRSDASCSLLVLLLSQRSPSTFRDVTRAFADLSLSQGLSRDMTQSTCTSQPSAAISSLGTRAAPSCRQRSARRSRARLRPSSTDRRSNAGVMPGRVRRPTAHPPGLDETG